MKFEYTWQILGTTAGATAAVTLIVQYVKAPLYDLWKIPARVIVYALSALVMACSYVFGGGPFTADSALLLLVNAFVVAMAAMGSYEVTFAKLEKKDETP